MPSRPVLARVSTDVGVRCARADDGAIESMNSWEEVALDAGGKLDSQPSSREDS